MTLPVLALSMGDPGGIGPEIIAAACDDALLSQARVLCFGDRGALLEGARAAGVSLRAVPYTGGEVPAGVLALAEVTALPAAARAWGRPNPGAGVAQLAYLDAALLAVQTGTAAALCTAPVTKKVIDDEVSFHFTGHTGYLARAVGGRAVMMLASEALRVVLVTEHVPLAGVSAALRLPDVAEVIVVTARGLARDFGLRRPRLAVAALNPHAGEGGLLGGEERDIIGPAVEAARRVLGEEAEVFDPVAADSLFTSAARARYDVAVCLYHDQGLIPLKALSARAAVNVTLGLSIVRTSPDHGTAYDIAGRGVADPSSLRRALVMAAEIAARRAHPEP